MSYRLIIPADDDQAASVVKGWIEKGKQLRNPVAVRWWVNYWYLKGCRNFTNINYGNGTVQVSYLDESGTLKFQYEEIVSKYQTQLGRLMALNLSPAIKPKGISLDGLRKSSIAQASLDAAFPDDKVLQLKMRLLPPLLQYGTVGLGVWVEDEDSIGIETIPPWELLPIPADVASVGEARGLMRTRWVPVDWVKGLLMTPGAKAKTYKEVETITVPSGQIPSQVSSKFQGTIASFGVGENLYISSRKSSNVSAPKKKDETTMDIAEFTEIWTETSDGYLDQYQIFVGGKRLYTADHANEKIHMPVRIVTAIEVGGFWGRSYTDLLIPINTEVEYMIGKVFQNIQEWDLYGLLMWPTSLGVNVEATRGVDGIKRIGYEPDYSVPDTKPFNISPANAGLMPARAMEIGLSLMDRIANQPTELLSGNAPGRVDSSAGIGLLYEMSGVPLSPTARNIAAAVSGCYKAILGIIRGLWKDDKIVDISHLDDSLAGIMFDSATGAMRLTENAIPHPDEITITVASEIPKSDEQQKMELNEALKMLVITPFEYRTEVRKRGLSLPVGNEVEWQNYRRAMMENLILFGDGKQPGQVVVSERDLHPVHLQVLSAFMARPEFYLASSAVRNAFGDHYDMHEAGMGKLPEGMPNMEQAASEAMGKEMSPEMMGGM